MDNVRDFLVTSKKYQFDGSDKLDRLQLLTGASCCLSFRVSFVAYIKENVSAVNILVGVLCNTLVHAPNVQTAIVNSSSDGDRPSLFKDLMVPPTCEEMLEFVLLSVYIFSRIFRARATEKDQLFS